MNENAVTGNFVEIDSIEYYKISNVHKMPAFFINIASNSDIWMFLSSNGALTAGRKNADRALFPYETDDKIHMSTAAGPKTVVKIAASDGKNVIWEPFDRGCDNPYKFKRNIYKSLTCTSIIFEEENETLGMSFMYKWETSEKFGIIRKSRIINSNGYEMKLSVLDGVLNVLPYGIQASLSDSSSCLTDAYKACELDTETGLAVYSLTSKINDTPEPVEMLSANVVWSIGTASTYLLSNTNIENFCRNEELETEVRSAGRKGAYLLHHQLELAANTEQSWTIIMDACLNHSEISVLQQKIGKTSPATLEAEINEDIEKCVLELKNIVAMSDGLQCTNDKIATSHHFMNVLYNDMRGGIFLDGYSFDYNELLRFINIHNKKLIERRKDFFDELKASGDNSAMKLKQMAFDTKDPDLIRLCLEFLPLCFSRRHGDPSRPWNKFFINLKDSEGKKIYHYEGNWRDIFQNWEAMCRSFPDYIENVIAKFLNASTADGFNPYHLSETGVDWEVLEPDKAFSGLGYWGDHQIIYLLRLLESLEAHAPHKLQRFIENDIFSYANIPYEIVSYEKLLEDSKNTIIFNYEKSDYVTELTLQQGSDGKLIKKEESVYYVSFVEKILVPIMAKLSNLVVGGGIWMNTQRPEWNDANNAIVGNGLSMVTVYQLYRHLKFCKNLICKASDKEVLLSNEVKKFLDGLSRVFAIYESKTDLAEGKTAKAILDGVGTEFSLYRQAIYTNGFSGKISVKYSTIEGFFQAAIKLLDYTIECSKRSDSLYNSYNILQVSGDSLEVHPLFPMLEGQTAVLCSGKLTSAEADELIGVMEDSGLYSSEHKSFYLYPIKKLKSFMERNVIPDEVAKSSKLIQVLVKEGKNPLIAVDATGKIRFCSSICQAKDLIRVLEALKDDERFKEVVQAEYDLLLDIYESIFQHRYFTGRSGNMYKYEGIGCIYWHQNSKLLLSFQECFNDANQNGDKNLPNLKDTYYRIRNGLGFNKEPDVWGAFPLEPYSHSPLGQPAQQPGMTGQVKEEVLTRFSELGLFVQDGCLKFIPSLLRRLEFLENDKTFSYMDINSAQSKISLSSGELAFTVCQTPVIYRISTDNKVEIETYSAEPINESAENSSDLMLDKEISRSIFEREGRIKKIIVHISESELIG